MQRQAPVGNHWGLFSLLNRRRCHLYADKLNWILGLVLVLIVSLVLAVWLKGVYGGLPSVVCLIVGIFSVAAMTMWAWRRSGDEPPAA